MDFTLAIEDVNQRPGADPVFLGEFVFRIGEVGPRHGAVGLEGTEFFDGVVVDADDRERAILELRLQCGGDCDDALGVRDVAVPEKQDDDFSLVCLQG